MRLRKLLLSGIFAALTVIGALFLKIPVPGLPLVITLQTFFVFLSGLMLEARFSFLSQFTYAAIGLLGLPVFSQGGGIGYLLHPSFGFIIGFCVCAPLVSVLVRRNLLKYIEKKNNRALLLLKAFAGALASIAVMYIFGVLYMYIIYNAYLGEPKTLWFVTASATDIYIVMDIIKFSLAIPLCIAVYKRVPKNLLA